MVAIPQLVDPTLAIAGEEAVRRARRPAGPKLGMSIIGELCERQLWYRFRWCAVEDLTVDAVYRQEDGYHGEEVLARRLRLVPGVELHTVDVETGRQFGFAAVGGHVYGAMDGAVRGLLQAPKAWHVWDGKITKIENFNKLDALKAERGEKAALAAWNTNYYAQAVLYMDASGMERHYLTVGTPGARNITSVRTEHDPVEAARLRAKAHRVITSAAPLPRIADEPGAFVCRFCPAKGTCHTQSLPAVSCRTCVHASPALDGDARWTCARWQRDLSVSEQRTACDQHRFIPALVTFAGQVDASAAANWIEYRLPDGRTFRNGEPGTGAYTSAELRAADPAMLCDPAVDALRMKFDGRFVHSDGHLPRTNEGS